MLPTTCGCLVNQSDLHSPIESFYQPMFDSPQNSSVRSLLAGVVAIGALAAMLAPTRAAQALPNQPAGSVQPVEMNLANFPPSLGDRLRQDLSQQTGIVANRLRVVEATPQTWSDGCFGLGKMNESCIQVMIDGWRVVISSGTQQWAYRTDTQGRSYRLESAAPIDPPADSDTQLPARIRDTVLTAAAQNTGLPPSELQITQVRRITTDGCLNLPFPGEACTKIAMPAWEATVAAGADRLVYHVDRSGKQARFNAKASQVSQSQTSQISSAARSAVLRAAAQATGQPIVKLRITQVRSLTTDGCLSLPKPGEVCSKIAMPAWEATVRAGQRYLVYRVDRAGQQVRLNTQASPNPGPNARQIPANELPPALEKGVVFRAISSGGITGGSGQTVLYQDGRVVRVGRTANSTLLRRISIDQVRAFQRLLQRYQFKRFDRRDYPATPGSADYITVVLSSPNSTVRYADTIVDELPQSLRDIVQAWNQIVSPR